MIETILKYNIHSEEDITNKNNFKLCLLAAGFFVFMVITVYICLIYFQHSVDKIRFYQSNDISSNIIKKKLNKKESVWLSGNESIINGNKSMNIDDAINKYIESQKNNSYVFYKFL